MNRIRIKALSGAAGLVLALLTLILLNILAGFTRIRADLTAEKLYTLSSGTLEFLRGLERDVTLKLYFSRSAEHAPMTFKHYGRRIHDLLREYEDASRGRVIVEALDPKPDSDAEEWAQRYGLAATRLDPAGERPPVYLGVVALAGGRQSVVPFFSPADEPQLEYILTRLIYEVTATTKPKVGVISPLPVLGSLGGMFGGRNQDPWIVMQELRAVADLVDLPGSMSVIPDDVETLLLIHPRNIPDTTLYAIDQFILRGGRLMAFVDPVSLTELETQSRSFRDPFSVRSDLNRLISTWGLTMPEDRVAADDTAATRVAMPDGTIDRHRGWLTLREPNFNREEVSVSALSLMQMPLAGWFSGNPVEGLTLTPLITVGPGAGSMSVAEATMGSAMGFSSYRQEEGPLHLALRLQGRFRTAFPDGRPGNNPDQPNDTPGDSPRPAHLTESVKETAVVLVADADLIYDAFAARPLPIFGRGVYQLMNDNINFAANIAGQLGGGTALIALRSRGTFDRPFHRVLALQAKAQERWRQEEQKLQEQLRLTQMRIDELQAAKSEDQMLIISPEQRQEIEKFRRQLADTRRALKEVRKNLRREIEELGLRLKVINFAAMPGLVILFGLARGWRRRTRARRIIAR
jgi:ABC-type uncharacterized transport system involved in gliding motility auxiliary subunit